MAYLTSPVRQGTKYQIYYYDSGLQKRPRKSPFQSQGNADIQNEENSIGTANYVYRTSTGDKTIRTAFGSTFTTSGNPGDTDGDGKITLIDLSTSSTCSEEELDELW